MKRTLLSLTALLTATLLFGSVHAQAQTTTNAIVTAPGAQPMVMPLNIYTLPYGTVTIADGVYYIANYEGTGISIYIQSPTALHVATLEEMVRYQAEWARVTQLITQAPSRAVQKAALPVMPVNSAALALPAPAPLVQAAPQVVVPAPATYAVSKPVQPQTALPLAQPARTTAPTVSAAQVFNLPAQTYMAPPVAQPAVPVQAQPAVPAQLPAPVAAPQAMPTSAQAFNTPAQTPMPTSAQAFNTPAQTAMPVSSAQAFNMPPAAAFAPQAPVPVTQAPAAAPWNTAVTLIPNYLHVNFRGRGNTVSYSISNASDTSSVQIDPNSLRAYQNGQPISAQLTVRDSSSGAATGTLMPRAMLVGTVKISTLALDPVTLTWQARDTTGRTYPISYAWMPQ